MSTQVETIIARQPIFDSKKHLFAYELLYRGGELLSLDNIGGDRATTSVLTSSYLTEGLDKISANKPCFVNFTEELLIREIAESFPPNTIIVEIIEDVHPTAQIIEVCKKLKDLGYILTLDDFTYHDTFLPLVELADIIKIDFREAPIDRIGRTLDRLSGYKIEFLAEKVETYQEFHEASNLGFSYFQGYFFARPEVLRIKEIGTSKLTLLSLLFEINKKSMSVEKLTKLISAEAFLSYRLLRYLNSAYFYLINEIRSIAHAVAYLGEDEIRRFVTLAVISEISCLKPPELIRLAAVRAKFCENLGKASPRQTNPSELFMLGLFSLLHAMLDSTMDQVVNKIPISGDVKQALTCQTGPVSLFLEVVIAYERGNRERCFEALKTLGIAQDQLYPLYISALEFADVFVNL